MSFFYNLSSDKLKGVKGWLFGCTSKYWTRSKMFARDERSNLFVLDVSDEEKKKCLFFYNLRSDKVV
jgi:hypothetical protein